MGKHCHHRLEILISMFLLAASCENPSWNGDVEGFVETGLSNVCLREAVFDSDGSAINYLTSAEETIIRVNMANPQQFAVTYTLTADDGTLYENDPESNLTISDYKTLVFPVNPTLAAEHQTLGFTLSIYVASINRTYPDERLEFSCETAPNPPEALIGGTTDNDKAMIAFQIPQEDTDEDIATIEIIWGIEGSGSTTTATFDIDDSSLTSPPADGENLLGAEASQNRYFYPSSAITGSVYTFKVTLIDESGRRSESRSTASDLVEYSLTYNANGSDSGSVPTSEIVEYGETAIIADNTGNLTRSGYGFGGWNTEADGSGTDYTPGQSVVMDSGNLVLYAKWLSYTLTYMNTNTDVSAAPPAAVGYGSGDTVTVLGYDSLGYSGNIVDNHYLLGWDTVNSASTVVYEVGDTFTMGAADRTLYAVWAECMSDSSDLAGITDMSGDYYLLNDITLTGAWTDYIGGVSDPFEGRFFGNGYTISGLNINTADDYIGLFGAVGSGGEIYDLNVDGTISSSGGTYVGMLAGYSYINTIENCSATGTITAAGTGTGIGGLVGYSDDTVYENCETDVEIISTATYVGGITGYAAPYCTLSDCESSGDITGGSNVGGIVGHSYAAAIDQCTVNGNVTGTSYVGGIVGQCYVGDDVTNCTVNGNVTGTSGNVGGLIGLFNHYSGSVEDCTVAGVVYGDGNNIGGLIGCARGVPITGCEVTGGVICDESSSVGGLVGYYYNYTTSASTISDCSVTGSVTVGGYNTDSGIGGLIGTNENLTAGSLTIENCSAAGDVTAVNDKSYIGGLIGANENSSSGDLSVTSCYALGEVNGWNYNGGLVGYNLNAGTGTSTLYRCFAAGDVSGNSVTGGLVGYSEECSSNECYAAGDLWGDGTVGGLIGINSGAILDCYAVGNVDGTVTANGGLVYDNTGSVETCYYGGVVGGDLTYNCLFITNTSAVSNCYYRSNSSTGGNSTEGYPMTAVEMQDAANYDTNWNFTSIWNIDTGTPINSGYPYLRWFYETYGIVYEP